MANRPRFGGLRSREKNEALEVAREAHLADIASRYYVERLTQEEIARQIGRSVATVSRLLAKAEAAEIVEVRVRYPVPIVPALQTALAKRFGLRTARVARISSDDSRSLITQISDLAARHISTLLSDETVIAVAWGSTIHGVVYAIMPGQQRDMHVVQGVGSLGSRLPSVDNPLLIQVLAQRLNASPHYLPAPMIVESVEIRDALSRDPHFKATLELGRRADIALVGIGQAVPDESGLVRAGYLDWSAMERIRSLGAVGDMMVEFYDIDGRILETEIRPRVMGMREAELRNTRSVIAVAGGSAKVAAMLGALRTGLVHTLVTDNVTARRVLELDDARPIKRLYLSAIPEPATPVSPDHALPHRGSRTRESAAAPCAPASTSRNDLEAILSPLLTLQPGRLDTALTGGERGQLHPEETETLRQPLLAAIQHGQSQGEVAPECDPELMVDMLLGALWYRRSTGIQPLDRTFLHGLIAAVVRQPSLTPPLP